MAITLSSPTLPGSAAGGQLPHPMAPDDPAAWETEGTGSPLAAVAGGGSSLADPEPGATGIPQSTAAPEGMISHLDAAEVRRRMERERKEWEQAKWRADAQAKVFGLVLGDADARRGIDITAYEGKPDPWAALAVDSYLRVFLHGKPLPDTVFGRDLLRFQVAHLMFNGRGADSDGEFHGELSKAAQAYKQSRAEAGDRAAQARRYFKARRVYGPEADGKGEESMAGLEMFAREAGLFVPLPWVEQLKDFTGWNERGQEERVGMYESMRETVAGKYGLTEQEIDDVVKHRLGAQEKMVSRDALGQVHIRNEVFCKGLPEIQRAITQSDLTPQEKAEELRTLPQRHERFKTAIVESTIRNMPELAEALELKSAADYEKLTSILSEGAGMQALGGGYVPAASSVSFLAHVGGLFEEKLHFFDNNVPYLEKGSEELDRQVKIREAINALSHEFNREKVEIFGVDAAIIGNGLYSAAETVAVAAITAPLAPELIAGRVGGFARTINAVTKALPVAGIYSTRQGFATYDQAKRMNLPEEQAVRLGWYSGLIEGVTTIAFSAIPGGGGLENIGTGAAREAFRDSLRGSLRSAFKESAKASGKNLLGEMTEEQMIRILDNAFVQTTLRPGMTAEEFRRELYETAVVTFISSAPFALGHGMNVYQETLENNARIREGMVPVDMAGTAPVDGVETAPAPVSETGGGTPDIQSSITENPPRDDSGSSPSPLDIDHNTQPHEGNAEKNRITIHEREENTVISSFQGEAGEARIVAELVREGDTLILRGAHIEGKGTLKEALAAAKEFGREQGAKRVIIEGGRRTTGAKPRHTPRPITIDTGL